MQLPRIALICASEPEFQAVEEIAGGSNLRRYQAGPELLAIQLDHVQLVVRKLPRQGNLEATAIVQDTIRRYRPVCIVGIGTCMGVGDGPRSVQRCDIVIGRSVFYYERGTIHEGRTDWKPMPFSSLVPAHLLNTYAPPDRTVYARAVPLEGASPEPKVLSGPYASGELVIGDRAFASELRGKIGSIHGQQVAAADMESAGLARACEDLRTPFFIAKAVSDFGRDSNWSWGWEKCAAMISAAAAIEWARSLSPEAIWQLQEPTISDLPTDLFERARLLATMAGAILPAHGLPVSDAPEQGPDDVTTRYDLAIEEFLTKNLPGKGQRVFSEEKDRASGTTKQIGLDADWIVDPVDGSLNLREGRSEVAISIAYYSGRRPMIGVIHLPYREMTVAARSGGRLEVNGIPWTRRKSPDSLADAFIALPGDLRKVAAKGSPAGEVIMRVCQKAAGIRVTGSIGYDLACLAMGEIDARISTQATPYDVAAGVLLVESIGGQVTNLTGEPWTPTDTGFVAAANPQLHARLLDALQENPGVPTNSVRL